MLEKKRSLGHHCATKKSKDCSQISRHEMGLDINMALPNDRYQLELAAARELLCTYEVTKKKVLTDARIKHLEKLYGTGVISRIRTYMTKLQEGTLE